MNFGDERLPQRFWDKVSPEPNSGCWLWTAAILRKYGRFRFGADGTATKLAHRGAYQRLVGPVPEGMELDHLCRTPSCVNPAHLRPISHYDNVMCGDLPKVSFLKHAAKTHCPKGHPYDEANTYHAPGKPNRQCRQCQRERQALRPKASRDPGHAGEARREDRSPAVGCKVRKRQTP